MLNLVGQLPKPRGQTGPRRDESCLIFFSSYDMASTHVSTMLRDEKGQGAPLQI